MLRRGRLSVLVGALTAGLLFGSLLFTLGGTAVAGASVSSSNVSSHTTIGHLTRAARTHGPYAAPIRLPLMASTDDAPDPFKPGLGHDKHNPPPPSSNAAIPVVTCAPILLSGCDTIGSSNGGATTNPHAMAAPLNPLLYGGDIEPPDQGLCAGNGFVMESINIGEIQVYDPTTLDPVSSPMSLDALMDLTAKGWSSGGDIGCLYDPDNGGHWFINEFVSTNDEASGGPFTGCFAGAPHSCREGIAVSSGNNPLTSTWNVYFLNPNTLSPNDPGAGFLLNDFAKMGNTSDALLLSYDEYNLGPTLPDCPSYGCFGFNGSQELALQKSALESGSMTVNLVHENMGSDGAIQPPDGSCASGPTAGAICWYSDIPAQSPSDSDFDNAFGGMGFVVGSLEFTGGGDNRVAAFYWKGLSNLNSSNCASCSSISFGDQVFTGEPYTDEGASCPAAEGGFCSLAAQKAGTLDLGTYCKKLVTGVMTPRCPENGIATNGDGTTQASYVGGHLYWAISTLVNEQFGSLNEIHTGAAYWIVSTSSFTGPSPTLTLASQGYVAAAHEDIEFPTLVGGRAFGNLMSFTLSGNGGPTGADNGGYFPSSAFGRVTNSSGGLVGSRIHISALGQGPQDGFTEYQPFFGPNEPRPRWGDYGAAVFVPGVGFYFASEYIPYPTCNPTFYFRVDRTCGGTRDQNANFGTSLNRLG
jgi:hypothetical protein